MNIDHELILKLEKLSKLKLSEEERTLIQQDLNEILKMIEKLEELDMTQQTPLTHMTSTTNNMRGDEVLDDLPLDKVKINSPSFEDRYFRVPKVIKK